MVLAPLLITFGDGVAAQEDDKLAIPPGESTLIKRKSIVIVRKRGEKEESEGMKLKNFFLYPSISLTEYIDDNVFAADESEQDDLVTVITPALELKSDWTVHELKIKAGLEAVRHADLSSENTDNAWLELDGRYEFSQTNRVLAGFTFMRDHEDRASADAAAGENPTEFDERSASIGLSGNRSNHFYRLMLDSRKLDYDDVGSPLGEIDYDDRDRDERSLGLRYLYRYKPSRALFLELEADERDYAQTPDNEGIDRNSDGTRYAVGAELIGSDYVGRIYAGRLERDYAGTGFENADELDIGWRLNWKLSDSTRLIFGSRRSIEETVLDNSPGYLMSNASVRLRYAVTREKTLNFDLIGANADYFSIDRDDDYLNLGIGYHQQVMPNLAFDVDVHHASRNSSVATEDYRINQVFVRLRASL